jgi:curved DNA-binding protein CbpA
VGSPVKDFYKILGVKETASEQEIRARWIALTKRYHPDLGKTDGRGDAKIKEINEAYEVLKDDSKRLDYDLDRTIEKFHTGEGQSRKERRMNIQKIILPAGILVLCLIVGLVIFRWFRVAVPPKSEILYRTDKVLQKKSASEVPPAEKKLESPVPSSPFLSPVEKESKQKKELVPQVVTKSEIPAKAELPKQISRQVPKKVSKEVPKEVPKDSEEVPEEINQILPRESAKMDQPKSAVMEPPPSPKTERLPEVEQVRPPSLPFPPLFAKEDEVKQFFADYRDRYTQKDIDRFLSLFSIRAIHNQKDGFDGIRKIYANFFDQSQELKFRLEDTKIEIYQNMVEVKARFRVDQILRKRGEEKVWKGNIRWVLMREEGALKILSLDYRNEKTP